MAASAYRARATSEGAAPLLPPRSGAPPPHALSGAAGLSSGPLAEGSRPPALFDFTLPLVRQGFVAVVDDSFTRCFKSKKVVRWSWNCYLWPTWAVGVLVRYLVLFPCRLLCLLLGFVFVFLVMLPILKLLGRVWDMRRWEIL